MHAGDSALTLQPESRTGRIQICDPGLNALTVPAHVNARQTYIVAKEQQGHDIHRSQGVTVFGIGYLPMNTMFTGEPDSFCPAENPM